MRVVDDEHVSALTSHRTADTDSEIVAAFVGVPTASRLTIRRQRKLGKNRLVRVRVDEVTHLTTEAHSQLGCVRTLDDFLVRELAEEPRRQQVAGELRLSVSRRHVDDEPLQLPARHALERIGHLGVVPAPDECRPHFLDERHELLLGVLVALELFEFLKLGEQLLLLMGREQVEYLRDVCEGDVVRHRAFSPNLRTSSPSTGYGGRSHITS